MVSKAKGEVCDDEPAINKKVLLEQIFLKEGILTFLCSTKFISFTDFRSFSLFSLEDKTLCSLE